MTIYINSKVKIDRIKLGNLGISFKVFTHFKSLTQDFQSINPILFGHKNIVTDIKAYRASITYKIAKGQNVIRLEAGSSKSKFCYVTWEFWPRNIAQSEITDFIEIIKNTMNEEPCFIYQNVFQHGKITYLELACDLITPDIYSLIFWKPKTQKGSIYQYKQTNKKGSILIGSATSNLYFFIYNKAKQLKAKGQYSLLNNYTRIEARLRKTKLTISELINIKSPFDKLHVASAIDCKTTWSDSTWLEFLDKALNYGYPEAISIYDKPIKKVFRDRLLQCKVSFWQPKNLLNNLDDEIAKLHPNNFNFS